MARLALKTKNNNIIPEIIHLEIPETKPPEITNEQLISFLSKESPYSADELLNNLNRYQTVPGSYTKKSLVNLIKQFIGVNTFTSCCGVGERNLSTILDFINHGFSAYEIGRIIYYLFSQAWNAANQERTSLDLVPRIGSLFAGYTLCAAYVFTSASHQDVRALQFLQDLGAFSIDIGVNPKYPKNSNHSITILIINIKDSVNKFIEIHREQLVKDYLTKS